jgi:GGDEF domain-containing protein
MRAAALLLLEGHMHPLLLWALCVSLALLLALISLVRTHCQLRDAYADRAYGVLTRAGGEAAWRRIHRPVEIIFLDLDHIHQLNLQLGYAEVDARIRAAIHVRQSDLTIFRWYSGDEIVVVVPLGDGLVVAERLRQSLRRHGLSGTLGVIPATSRNLTHEVSQAAALVQAAKAADQRGQVHTTFTAPHHSRTPSPPHP